MNILKNQEVTSSMIHHIRSELKGDTKQVRKFLGLPVSDIPKEFPIKVRSFDIWVIFDNNHIVGVITFKVGKDEIAFIKQLYVCPDFRNRGYAKQLLQELIQEHPKIDCTINGGNTVMYHVAKSVGIRRHKPSEMLAKLSGRNTGYKSRCFSNYFDDEIYV